jgi:hypothetical protein
LERKRCPVPFLERNLVKQARDKRIEVYIEDGPVRVEAVTPPVSIELGHGVRLDERFYGDDERTGKFRLTGSKLVAEAGEVGPAYGLLKDVMERIRLIWPFAGGTRLLGALVSNHERVCEEFLEEQGQHRVSRKCTMPISISGTYSTMPLAKAAAILHQLGKLPGEKPMVDRQKILWLCVEWYEMASAAGNSLDKFVKSFPPLDLLASTHFEETFQRAEAVQCVLDQLAKVIADHEGTLPPRVSEVLQSNLRDVGLRDKFEEFVRAKFPSDAEALAETFSELNRIRNALFHMARYGAIDEAKAEATRQLLWRSLLGEIS